MRLSVGRLALLLSLVLLPILSVPVGEFFAADACLNRGGSFDYVLSRCDMVEGHAYLPVLPRWRSWLDGPTVGLSLFLLVGAVLLLRTQDRRRASPSVVV